MLQYNPAKVGVLEELRADGFKVFVSHKRVFIHSIWPDDGEHVRDFAPDDGDIFITKHAILANNVPWSDISHTGGVTTITLYKGEELVGEGVSYCCINDAFNKHRGLTIALGRALKHAVVT